MDPDKVSKSDFSTKSFFVSNFGSAGDRSQGLVHVRQAPATELHPQPFAFNTRSCWLLRPALELQPFCLIPPGRWCNRHTLWNLAVLHLLFSYWVKDPFGISIHAAMCGTSELLVSDLGETSTQTLSSEPGIFRHLGPSPNAPRRHILAREAKTSRLVPGRTACREACFLPSCELIRSFPSFRKLKATLCALRS